MIIGARVQNTIPLRAKIRMPPVVARSVVIEVPDTDYAFYQNFTKVEKTSYSLGGAVPAYYVSLLIARPHVDRNETLPLRDSYILQLSAFSSLRSERSGSVSW